MNLKAKMLKIILRFISQVRIVRCRFFGHKYVLKIQISPYIREIKCTRCKQEFGMNDQTQSVLPLDNELREIHRVLKEKRA